MKKKHRGKHLFSIYLWAVGQSLLWTFLVVFIGLLQILIAAFISLVFKQDFDILKVLHEGALLFFAIALVAGITIDYYFDENSKLSKKATGMIFAFLPFVVTTFSVVSFVVLHIADFNQIDVRLVSLMQYCALIGAIIYAVGVKFFFFAKLEIEK